MSHRIYIGSFASLEARWLAEVAELQSADPLRPVPVLVGSNILASYLKVRLAGSGRAAANVRFMTFLDLVRRLSGRRGDAAKPRLPRLGVSILMHHVLSSRVPEAFRDVAQRPGFCAALLETFRDLRDSGITPAEFDNGVRRQAVAAPDRREHLLGLADLHRRFRSKVALFWDVDDDFRSAIERAPRARLLLGADRLLVYGIYDVTGQQSELLGSLKSSLEMNYFVPCTDDDMSGFSGAFIATRARELGVRPESPAAARRDDSLGSLGRAGFGLRAAPKGAAALADDGSVIFLSAPGESRVAVEIVREILSAVRDRVISGFHEAAVILRHAAEQAPILAEAMRLRGIPHFVYGGSCFDTRPLCLAALALARLQDSGFSRQSVLNAMELAAAALPAGRAGDWQVQQWRRLTNDGRFLAGVASWDAGTGALLKEAQGRWSRIEDEDDSDDELQGEGFSGAARWSLEASRSLREAWLAVKRTACDWPESGTWQGWSRLLHERLTPLFGECEDWPALSATFDDLGSLTGAARLAGIDSQVSRAGMLSLLCESLASHTLPQGRFLRDGVNLLPVSAARGLRFPLVIVPGLDEGSFPARLRQDPLLLDAERAAVGGLYSRLPLKSQRWEEEKLLFEMAAASAQRRLVLVSSRLDESTDRERIPSEFFLRAAGAASGLVLGLRDLREGVVPGFRSVNLENPAPRPGQVAVDEGEIRLRLVAGERGRSGAALAAMADLEPELIRGPLAYDRARWTRRLTQFDGRLFRPGLAAWAARRAGPAAGQVSASGLEQFARCPYRFYLKRVLGLEGWDEPRAAAGLDPLERGRAVHEILEQYVRSLGAKGFSSRPPEELRAALAASSRTVLDTLRPAGTPDLLWEVERESLETLLQNWLHFECSRAVDGYAPAAFENPFGTLHGHELPPYPVAAGASRFEFRGRIDRIDVSADGKAGRVIDYKTGRIPETMNRPGRRLLMAGEKIQIAVYRGALGVLPEFRKLESVEGEYLFLQPRDRKVVACRFSDGALREAGRRLERVLEVVAELISGGVYFARTAGAVRPEGHCDFCEYLVICGKDRAHREELKSEDPAVARFGEIAEIDPRVEDA